MRKPDNGGIRKRVSSLAMAALVPLLLLGQTGCFGATYYISASQGADTNDGLSATTAWQSLDRIYVKSVSRSNFQPGDKILLKRGDIWDGQVQLNAKGSESDPIVLGSYGDGPRPVIDGDNPRLVWSPVPVHPDLYRSSPVGEGAGINRGFQGQAPLRSVVLPQMAVGHTADVDAIASKLSPGTFGVTGSAVWLRPAEGQGTAGIRLFRSSIVSVSGSFLIIEDLDLRRAGSGIYMAFADHITARNNNVEDTLGLGILLSTQTKHSMIEGNTVSRTGNDSIYVLHGESNTIRHNVISEVVANVMGFTVKGDQCGIGLQESKDTLVEHNEGHFVRVAVDYYFDEGGIVRYNYFDSIYGAGAPHGTDLWVYGNIFNLKWQDGSGKTAMNVVNTGVKPIRVFNNVFYHSPAYGLRASSKQGPVVFRNNIVYATYPDALLAWFDANVSSDYNCFYADGAAQFKIGLQMFKTFQDYQARSGYDAHSKFTPPEFAVADGARPSDFRLKKTSGCLSAGVDVKAQSLLPEGQDFPDFDGDDLPPGSAPSPGIFWNSVPARSRTGR
ncbi:MAG: right-handed parallel beta-helix repeat-containing protein [Bryobacteraceae bacterium]